MLIYLLSENDENFMAMKGMLKSRFHKGVKNVQGAEGILFDERGRGSRYLMLSLDEYPDLERHWMPAHIPIDMEFEEVIYDPSDSHQAVSLVREMIDCGYMHKASAKEYAHRVSMSETYLCRVFKNETGHSIGSYINNERMEKAARLLIESDIMIRDVALTVGYNNFSYFCKRFKKHFGMTPNAYRYSRRIINNEEGSQHE